MRNNLRKWMLGAAVAISGLGLTATSAHAAQFGIYVGAGGPAAYVPPSPGAGYQWVAGYYDGGYWVPGRWSFVGVSRHGYGGSYYVHRDRDRHWDRDDDRRWDRRRDRGWDWDGDRHRDRDRDRGWEGERHEYREHDRR